MDRRWQVSGADIALQQAQRDLDGHRKGRNGGRKSSGGGREIRDDGEPHWTTLCMRSLKGSMVTNTTKGVIKFHWKNNTGEDQRISM